jgi:Lar family restriction alleviation protein
MNREKLKDCPLCGGKTKVRKENPYDGDYRVYCTNCNMQSPYMGRTEKEAIDFWNKQ